MDIGKLTTGISTRQSPASKAGPVSMSKADLEQVLKAWNTADIDTKLNSLATVYDKADQLTAIKHLLTAAGMSPTHELMDMANAMLEGGLSLDVDSFKKFKQQAQLFNLLDKESQTQAPADLPEPLVSEVKPAQTLDKTLLVLKNNLPINTPTSHAVNQFTEGKLRLPLDELARALVAIEQPPLKAALIQQMVSPELLVSVDLSVTPQQGLPTTVIPPTTQEVIGSHPPDLLTLAPMPSAEQPTPLTEQVADTTAMVNPAPLPEHEHNVNQRMMPSTLIGTFNADQLTQLLEQSYQLDLTQPKVHIEQSMDRLLHNLHTLSETLADPAQLEQLSPETRTALTQQLHQIQQQVSFAQSLDHALYLPLPLVIDKQPLEAQLFIFKDSPNSSQKKGRSSASALIGIDTANLGRVETYIQKIDEQLHLQFRMDQPRTLQLFKHHLALLTDQLSVSSVSYSLLDEPFTPLAVVSDIGIGTYDGFEVLA